MAPRTGLEPVTSRLTAGRSTIELSRNVFSRNDCSIHYVHAFVNTFWELFLKIAITQLRYMEHIDQPERDEQENAQADNGDDGVEQRRTHKAAAQA